MSEYNIQMNKYNALNAEYDQLYPKPMKHANTHASGGTDPITPSDIGAYSKSESDTLLAKKAGWSQNKIDGSVLDWAKSQNIPTSGYIGPDNTDVPNSSHWLVNVLMSNVDSNWKVVVLHGITNNQVWYNIYNYGNWNGWKQLATATDLDTKVSKSGDTMSNILRFANTGSSPNAAEIIEWTDGLHIREKQDDNNYADLRLALYDLRFNVVNAGNSSSYIILHEGNAQSLGFTKIATGSYVGTGVAGQGQQTATVLTFNFAPKFLILVQDEGVEPGGTTLLSKVGAYSIYGYSGFYHFYTYSSGFACKLLGWGTNTLSYYTNGADATYQFNASGKTYYYMALG